MSRLLFLRDGCIICGATTEAKNSLSAEFVVDAINDHLAGSVEAAFCMRALASLKLSPRMWAVYLSPGVEAR